jgi:hypothetical protein
VIKIFFTRAKRTSEIKKQMLESEKEKKYSCHVFLLDFSTLYEVAACFALSE